MTALTQSLLRDDGRPLLVGFSGGLDSTVLLHLCAESAVRERGLRALHVHHGLQPQADAWARHCEHACAALDVPLQVVHVQVTHEHGHGPEAAARHARHAAFEQALRENEILALAHHRDDQAETFLLRALRASGPDGLAAMRPWRAFGRGWLWRPLLESPRSALLAYAREHALAWIEDPSNADHAPDRNFLRHQVLPLLQQRWPHADAAFARSAALNADALDLLDAEDAQVLAQVRTQEAETLDVAALLALPRARRARVLRRWIAQCALPPLPGNGVERIEHDLLQAAPDADPIFAWSGAQVRRWRNLLHARPCREVLSPDWQMPWDGRAPLPLPGGGQLALVGAAGFDQLLRAHARRGGERILLPRRKHSHPLKHVLQDSGVPPWLRERLPLLSDGDGQLLAAGDVHAAALADWLHGRAAQLVWTRA